MTDGPWKCFFCGDTFTDRHAAFLHFGGDEECTSACKLKASEGGLIEAVRAAEEWAAKATAMLHDESSEGVKAYREAMSRHAGAVAAAEQVGYERGLDDRRGEVERLRRIVVRYGDRVRMANCPNPGWQIEIDEAMRFVADNPEAPAE